MIRCSPGYLDAHKPLVFLVAEISHAFALVDPRVPDDRIGPLRALANRDFSHPVGNREDVWRVQVDAIDLWAMHGPRW